MMRKSSYKPFYFQNNKIFYCKIKAPDYVLLIIFFTLWKYEFFRKNKSPFLTNGLKYVIIIIGILKTAGGAVVDFGEAHYFHLPTHHT